MDLNKHVYLLNFICFVMSIGCITIASADLILCKSAYHPLMLTSDIILFMCGSFALGYLSNQK